VDDCGQGMRAPPLLLAGLAALGILVPAGGAAGLDPRIEQSRAELRRARDAAVAATAALDDAVASYEEARAHLERLTIEQEQTREDVEAAQQAVDEADAQVRDRMIALYMHPDLRLEAIDRAVLSDDVGDALHRLELVDQLARNGARKVQRADRMAGRVRAAEHDHQVVTAGILDAVRTRRERASALGAALARARREVAAADRKVETVEATVAREEEQARRARERADRLARTPLAVSGGGTPPPVVGGRVCPVGTPHGFTDTWGAPRSGGRWHQGVDMFAAYGTPLYAVEDGTIRTSDNALGGVSVHLTGASGDAYYYAHMSTRTVVTGQRVRTGDVIGAVGDTGNARSTPPHLHFQYHPGGGGAVNPTPLATALCR
jgi:murein DD-endopeptidase MepM/ murein hydrolase activator NlpD